MKITTVSITLEPLELKEQQLSELGLEVGGREMGELNIVLGRKYCGPH